MFGSPPPAVDPGGRKSVPDEASNDSVLLAGVFVLIVLVAYALILFY